MTKKFLSSFVYAKRGLLCGLKERNMKIHFAVAFLVLILGFVFHLSQTERFVTIILIGLVITLELINTSIEYLCNIIRDKLHLDYEATKDIRNISAGAVLIASICAAIIGLVIFVPKILKIF